MAILKGAMTVRRFKVVGDVSAGSRDRWRDQLQEHAFRDPPQQSWEEAEGWCQVHNLLDTDFSDFNRWHYDDYVLFALRVDKKTLPSKLLRAHVDKKVEEWCKERNVERAPAQVKRDIKDALSEEWLKRVLPRVRITEACWCVSEEWLLLHSHAESTAERFTKRFHRTFGLELVEWGPLDHLDASDDDLAADLLNLPATSFSRGSR